MPALGTTGRDYHDLPLEKALVQSQPADRIIPSFTENNRTTSMYNVVSGVAEEEFCLASCLFSVAAKPLHRHCTAAAPRAALILVSD